MFEVLNMFNRLSTPIFAYNYLKYFYQKKHIQIFLEVIKNTKTVFTLHYYRYDVCNTGYIVSVIDNISGKTVLLLSCSFELLDSSLN